MRKTNLRSPLRYPGSKRRLANYIKQALDLNNLRPSLYIEPFVGGASVALQLLQDNLVEQIVLMDVDPWIASFWKTVFFDTDWLIDKIQTVEVTLDQWKKLKFSQPNTIREQAWACFFLNRTSFSGILEKKAGPLGGRGQTSIYKIDCRFPRKALIERICKIASYKNKIYTICCSSWEEGISQIRHAQNMGELSKNDVFFYFDPPFFEKAEDLYRYYFNDKDHIRLRDFLLTLEDKWILSYDSAEQVFSLYGDALTKKINGTHHDHVELLYSVSTLSRRKKAKEVVLSNLEKLPPQEEVK